jgi:hypothetical protein
MLLYILCLFLMPLSIQAQDTENFVKHQLQRYPQMRLLDLYKSCFQDFMGAEHLVSDREGVKHYLDTELEQTSVGELPAWYYEPCCVNGQYVRVSIRTVKEGLLTEEQLLDAFVRSANGKRPSVRKWKRQWRKMVATIDKMNLALPHYDEDKTFIDSLLSVGKYAISHSPEYRKAYHPHYRIVERGIFQRELKPLIDKPVSRKADD